ncbi:MAG: VanZ family protein [Acidobacteriota bacterium]
MRSVSSRLLMLWLLCVVAGTLAPFGFAADGGEHGLRPLAYGAFERDPVHFVFNMLLFMPLGGLLYHEARRRSDKVLPVVILAGMAGLSISLTIECLQAFLPTRDSSLIDLLANTVGSMIGVAADRRWGTAAEERLNRMRAGTSPVTLGVLMGGFLCVALLVSATLQAGTRLSNWDPKYPLLIGNEYTGDRPWRGRVVALDITDAATPADAVRRFSAGESVALPGARIATFAFNGGASYNDASGSLPGLEWTEPQSAHGQVGVQLAGTSWLQSAGPASELARRLQKTNAFTLHITCATDDIDQDGPARIVSNSVSPFLRNFTMGQQGSDLVFRLRTPDTGLNGYPLEIYVPGVFKDRHVRDILATYDGATLLVATAHGDAVSSTKLTPGASLALAIDSLHVLPDQLDRYELAYVAALSLIPGGLIGLLGKTIRERRMFSAAWVIAFAVLLETTTVGVSGGAFAWADVARTAAVGTAVLAVFNVIFTSANMPWRPSKGARVALNAAHWNSSPAEGISGATF